jgi:hypothetical protein
VNESKENAKRNAGRSKEDSVERIQTCVARKCFAILDTYAPMATCFLTFFAPLSVSFQV